MKNCVRVFVVVGVGGVAATAASVKIEKCQVFADELSYFNYIF